MLVSWNKKLIAVAMLTFMSTTLAFAQEEDPLEPMNRKLYGFHKWFDERFFRPSAVVYRAVVPPVARKSVSNFFSNIDELPITANNLFQLKPKEASISAARFLINTTIGIGGLFDVATPLGFEYRKADLGQSFAYWGWKNSTFIFIPLLGPSTTRDGIGIIGDLYMTPWPYLQNDAAEWSIAAAYAINQRSKYIDSEGILAIAALDEYAFLRDGYLQSRQIFISGEELAPDETGNEGDIL